MDQIKKRGIWPKVFYALLLPAFLVSGFILGDRFDVKYLSQSVNTSNLDYSSVEEAYDSLVSNFDGELSNDKLIDGLKKGLAEATDDPYTEYFSAQESEEFNNQLSGTFSGIGAELGKENNAVIIVAPLKGYPAEKAGVLPKDIILKINDEDALSLSISEAVNKIRGPVNTEVKLTLLRGDQQLEVSITRQEIKIPSVEYELLNDSICSISISRFADDTDELINKAAKECKAKGTTRVLVDLRNNPGGYLNQAIEVASHWVNQGDVIVTEKRGSQIIKSHKAGIAQEFVGMKTVVLINEGSASASEIVAGALKDYGLATLVGQKTYGKGSVQEVNQLSGGSSIKITIARWYTPQDKNIDQEGIEPDQQVELTREQAQASQDPQKLKALELLK